MTGSQWRTIVATITAAWPSSIWPDSTRALAESLLGPLDGDAVRRAVVELVRDGREFCPPPGVICKRVQEMAPSALALPPPDPLELDLVDSEAAMEAMQSHMTPAQIAAADALSRELRQASREDRMRLLGESIRNVARAKEMVK